MLIRALRNVAVAGTPGGTIYPGWVGDVEDGRAQRLIDAGHAISAEKLSGRDPALASVDTWFVDGGSSTLDAVDHTTMDDRNLEPLEHNRPEDA